MAELAGLFVERIDTLFEELSFTIHWQRPAILLVFFQSENIRAEAELRLEKRLGEIGAKVFRVSVDEAHYDIPMLLSQRSDRNQAVYFISGLSRGGGKAGANAYRALNMRREFFVDYSIRAVFWLRGGEATELSHHAPDFWAFRHRVVDLDDFDGQKNLGTSAGEKLDYDRGFAGQPDVLGNQIEQRETLMNRLSKHAESYPTRLALLMELAALYQAKKAYDLAIQRLKQGILIAKKMNNSVSLAKLWGNLGSVYLDLDQLYKAVRAYRKAIRLNPQETSYWMELGQVYQIEKRFSDAIMSYKQAIRLDPQNSSANSSLVACYRLQGKVDLAKEQRKQKPSI